MPTNRVIETSDAPSVHPSVNRQSLSLEIIHCYDFDTIIRRRVKIECTSIMTWCKGRRSTGSPRSVIGSHGVNEVILGIPETD